MRTLSPLARRALGRLAVLALLALSGTPALAQAFPAKPITLIIPFPPGGPTDVTGRVLAEKLSSTLGQPVVVDNRGGASGNVGAQAAARAPADGYTLFFATGGTHGVNPALYKNAGYDPIAQFEPVAWVTSSPNIIVVHPSFPARTLQELLELARKQPGKLSSAAPGQGSTPHMAGELFKRTAGVQIQHIPYKGSGPALNDVLGGHVPIMFDGIPSSLPLVRAGKLRALAVTSARRSASAPEIPAVAETLAGFEANGWFAVYAPKGTPRAIVMQLNREINKVLELPEIRQKYAELGAETEGGTPERLGEHTKAEVARWAALVHATGMTAE